MAAPYKNYVELYYGYCKLAFDDLVVGNTDYAFAVSSYGGGDDHVALGHLLNAIAHYRDAYTHSLGYLGGTPEQYLLINLLRECWEYDHEYGDAVNMDTILSAMVTATPDQVMYFVGLEDAYRQSIWTQPFNVEYFAALARGFAQWP